MPFTVSRRLLLASAATLFTSACAQLAFFAVNLPATFGDYSRLQDIRYGQAPRNTLDVYLPTKTSGPLKNAPVIVFFHGGGWDRGDKSNYKFVGAALAEQGYIAVLPNYSLYPKVKFPVFIDDAARAMVWVRDHLQEWGGDPQQLFLMGHSAGAHIAMLMTLDKQYLQRMGMSSNELRGVIGLSGPYDFIPFSFPYMYDLFGPAENFPASQPINFVRADAPPMFLAHGTADRTVVPRNTASLSQALRKLGVKVETPEYEGASHSDVMAAFSIPARKRLPVLDDVKQFIEQSR